MADPQLRKTYSGDDGTEGFVLAWDSDNKNVGKGEQEIKSIGNGSISYELRFIKPFEGICYTTLKTDAVSADQTKVTWTFSGPRPYMMRLMHLVLQLEKALGKDIATSLGNLKSILENKL